MSSNIPILPIAGGTLVRALLALVALVTSWLKRLSRARQNQRQAAVLAGLDRPMLADIGITRADLRDAFAEPFWDDPTALLRERAIERRMGFPRASRWRTVFADRSPGPPGDVTKVHDPEKWVPVFGKDHAQTQ